MSRTFSRIFGELLKFRHTTADKSLWLRVYSTFHIIADSHQNYLIFIIFCSGDPHAMPMPKPSDCMGIARNKLILA